MSPPSEKWGDTSPVSPTKLRPWLRLIQVGLTSYRNKENKQYFLIFSMYVLVFITHFGSQMRAGLHNSESSKGQSDQLTSPRTAKVYFNVQ